MEKLGKIRSDYYPMVNKIENELALYDKNRELNKQVDPKTLEFEYVKESSKTEYKDPVNVENVDAKKDKELAEKVKGLLPKVEDKKVEISTQTDDNSEATGTNIVKDEKEVAKIKKQLKGGKLNNEL